MAVTLSYWHLADGKLVIPVSRNLPLGEAREGQAAVENGGVEKVLLLA